MTKRLKHLIEEVKDLDQGLGKELEREIFNQGRPRLMGMGLEDNKRLDCVGSDGCKAGVER